MSEELLFSKVDIFSLLQTAEAEVKKRIQSIPSNIILNASEQDQIVSAFGGIATILRLRSNTIR